MDARGQRALARRNCREATEVVQEGPREDEIVESDTEKDEILEEREAVPLRIRIPGARARVGPPAAVPASCSSSSNSCPNRSWNVVKHG